MNDSWRYDRVETLKPDLLQDLLLKDSQALLKSVDADSQPASDAIQGYESLNGNTGGTLAARVAAQRRAKEEAQRAKEAAFKQATLAKKQAQEAAKDAAFQQDYEAVLDGIARSTAVDTSHIMGETQHVLNHRRRVKDSKKTSLYNEWHSEVFDRIQGRLQTAVGRRSEAQLMSRLRKQMDDYLHTTNTKLGVFNDVIIEDDYNPLAAHQHTIRVYTGDIRDPVKRDVMKPLYEKSLMMNMTGRSSSCPTSPASMSLTPLGKNTLDTKRWGTLAIHATPYGHNVDITGDTKLKPMSAGAADARRSRIPMDHYNYPLQDNAAAYDELGKPGKRHVPGPEVLRGRHDLYDVVQHTCHINPGFTGGDRWLEAKGKLVPPGPEQRRGRADLTEVLHQTSNPYKDGRSLGDQWMEAKGKAHPPGPEQRRGRADLSEIIQQSSNPYADGRSLGDQWLETKGKAPIPGPREVVGDFIFRDNYPPDPAKQKDPRRYISCLVNDVTLRPVR